MRLNQIYKLWHSKGNHEQNEKTTYRMGENICKRCRLQGLNAQVYQQLIQPSIKNVNMNTPSKKMGRRPKEAFSKRRHTDGQQALEKVIGTNYLKNVIKTTRRYYLTVRMAISENSTVIKVWRGCGEKANLPRHYQWDHRGVTAEAWIDRSLYQLTLDCRLHSTAQLSLELLSKLLSPPEEFSLRILFASLSLDSLKCQFLCIHRWCFYMYVSS